MGVQEKEQLWGGETTKAVANFPVSGETVPVPVIRWLGRIKGAAARVNGELDLLDADVAERIAAAADRVAAGEFDDQFPIDVFQTGSGTSTNMNANEVIANLAARAPTPTTTSTWASPPTTCFPRPSTSRRSTRPPTTCCPRSSARGGVAGQGRGVPGHRQVRPHASHGRGAGDPRAGVLRLRGADAPRPRGGSAAPCRRWRRSRSAAPPPAPG